jgi:hypothetical protein
LKDTYDIDKQWLIEKFGDFGRVPTEGEIDFFQEKVAVLTCDSLIDEEAARLTAARMIW